MLHVLMYHFVHGEGDDPVFKGIPGPTADEFEKQLEYMCANYQPISHDDLVNHFNDPEKPLPENSFYLTFDEGLRQQLDNALPIMEKFGLKSSLFIPTMPLSDRKVSLVEKQRVCQYTCFDSYRTFLENFMSHLFALQPQLQVAELEPNDENIRASREYLKEFDFYSDEERFYRKIRNEHIPPALFADTIHQLFLDNFASEDEFIDRYYLTWAEIREMQDMGTVIGGHSHSHPMLDKISVAEMQKEIDKGVEIMNENLNHPINSYAYPFGTYNQDVASYLKKIGMQYSFATGNLPNPKDLDQFAILRIDESSLEI